MAELFKNIYNKKFFEKFFPILKKVDSNFKEDEFLSFIFDDEWNDKELKQRIRHITFGLNQYFSGNYSEKINTILKIIEYLKEDKFEVSSLEFMIFPDFVEVYGLEDYKKSIYALEKITQFITCEFAVRPFILKYPDKMMQQMNAWSKSKFATVRRLSTEGCRPRLPWAMALPLYKQDPSPILPILEALKDDSSESVRRSVANNLNDISKDNPNLVKNIARLWKNRNKEIDSLIKHACRTLLKNGDAEMMKLFGFGSINFIKMRNFKLLTPEVKIGDYLEFSFSLNNTSDKKTLLRLEYALYYQKANGSLSKKVFKISEKEYAKKSESIVHRRHSFKIITTRKFHTGLHQVSVIINGIEFTKHNFKLI